MNTALFCARCLREIENDDSNMVGTGYARYNDMVICYHCCALVDQEYMREHGRIDLYLTFRDKKAVITNWPSSLEFTAISYSKSTTNWGDERTDVWFRFNGKIWWGVHKGRYNQIVRCKQTKRTRL